MKKIWPVFIAVFALFTLDARAYDIVTSPYLFGDWGGARTSLAEQGLDFRFSYGSETAHNYSGGMTELTEYTDQWVIGANVDFEKLGWWKGGSFQITMTDRNGSNLGAEAGIGNDMLIQEVYGRGQTFLMTQFWYKQVFFDNRLEWKIGRLTTGEDFSSFSCDFMNLSFCGSQPGNLVGSYWLNWPTSTWGTTAKWNATDETSWRIGAYEVNPYFVDVAWLQKNGWTLNNPTGATGTLIPAEFDWKPLLAGHSGIYRFGAWYNTAKGADLSNPAQYSAQFGGYISFEQWVTGTAANPGLSVFLNVTQADRATAATDRQISVGSQYHGPFGRVADVIGFAVGATHNNPLRAAYLVQTGEQTVPVVGNGNEYDTELYYSYAPIASLFLRPNLQYIADPGGTSQNQNAFVLGLKTGVNF